MDEPEKPQSPANQHLQELKNQLARVRIEPPQIGSFPEPPDEKGVGLGLTAGGALVSLGGVWLVWTGLLTLSGILLTGGLGALGYGGLLLLYGQFRGPLASRPMPNHPSSRPGDMRSVWETWATLCLVLGMLNVPLLLIVAGISVLFIHWAVALAAVVGANVLVLPFAWKGDGTNRRPVQTPVPPAG